MTLYRGRKNYGRVFALIMALKKQAKKVILDNTNQWTVLMFYQKEYLLVKYHDSSLMKTKDCK